MIDAGDSQVILQWSKNQPENQYFKIAILLVASAVAWAAASLNVFKDPAKVDNIHKSIAYMLDSDYL